MAAVLWGILVMVVLVMPNPGIKRPGVLDIPHSDKIVHFLLFFVLYILSAKATDYTKSKISKWGLFLIISLYALITECVQLVLEDRSFEFFDIIANITGALAALFFYNRK